jgi:hypothetical protein
MSYNLYKWRKNASSEVSSSDAGFITVYPINFCAQDFRRYTKTNDQPFW